MGTGIPPTSPGIPPGRTRRWPRCSTSGWPTAPSPCTTWRSRWSAAPSPGLTSPKPAGPAWTPAPWTCCSTATSRCGRWARPRPVPCPRCCRWPTSSTRCPRSSTSPAWWPRPRWRISPTTPTSPGTPGGSPGRTAPRCSITSAAGSRPADRCAPPRSAAGGWQQAQQPRRVLLEDLRSYLVLDRQLGEVGEPAIRGEQREVRPEQDLVLQQGVGVLDELRREVLRRPARQVDVDLRLVGGDTERLVLPGEGRMRQDDLHPGEADRHVVDVQRVGVLQADPAAAGHTGADAGLAGVEQRDRPEFLDRLVQAVRHPVVGVEPLDVRMEFEPLHAVTPGQRAGLRHPGLAAEGIDGGERDEHAAAGRGGLRDLLVRHRRDSC